MIQLYWKRDRAEGSSDLLPLALFKSEGTRSFQKHIIRGRDGRIYQAQCTIRVRGNVADLDYGDGLDEDGPNSTFNYTNKDTVFDPEIFPVGVMRLTFTDCSRSRLQAVDWQVVGGDFEEMKSDDVVWTFSSKSGREGEEKWRSQRVIERDSSLADAALLRNAAEHDGCFVCEACDFRHPDRAMFDAHHPHPLRAGVRTTLVIDLIVLCPICHRRAHRGENRMLPISLSELRKWNETGRP